MNKKIVLGSCFCIILITIAIILFFTTKSEYLNKEYVYSWGTTNIHDFSSIPGYSNLLKVELYDKTANSTGVEFDSLYKSPLILSLQSVENYIWTTVKQKIDDSIRSNLTTNNYIDDKKNAIKDNIETTINKIIIDLAEKVMVENYPYRLTYTNNDRSVAGWDTGAVSGDDKWDFFEDHGQNPVSVEITGPGNRSRLSNKNKDAMPFIIKSA